MQWRSERERETEREIERDKQRKHEGFNCQR